MPRFISSALIGVVAGIAPATAEMPQIHQSNAKIWAYPQAENHCPAGLQPVLSGGVISCGVANATGYGEAPAPRMRRKPVMTSTSQGKSDYVAYSKSPSDTKSAVEMQAEGELDTTSTTGQTESTVATESSGAT